MKKKIFMLLAMVSMTLAASAKAPALKITVGTNDNGSFAFTVNGNAKALDSNGEIAVNENDAILLTVTPNTGWVVNKPAGEWSAAGAAARSQRRAETQPDDLEMLKDFELTFESENQETGAKTYSFTMIRANAEISCSYKKLLQDSWIQTIADQTYTGEELEPVITVKDGSAVLVLGTDYTVEYSNNINACDASEEDAPTVTITAVETSEKYAGTASKTFTIKKANIDDLTEPQAIDPVVYSAYDQELIVAGSTEEGTILYSLDGEQWSQEVPMGNEEGEYTVYWKVVGDNNHNDIAQQTLTVTIVDEDMDDALDNLYDALVHATDVLAKGMYTHSSTAYEYFAAVIYKGIGIYVNGKRGDSSITPKKVVDMIRELKEAERIFNDDELVVGINDVNADDNVNLNDNLNGKWFDLNGRLLQEMPAKKGIYIRNGKKVIVK